MLTLERNVEIVTGNEKKKFVRIHDIRFQGKRSIDWRISTRIPDKNYKVIVFDKFKLDLIVCNSRQLNQWIFARELADKIFDLKRRYWM